MKVLLQILIVVAIGFLLYLYYKHSKKFNFSNMIMINGSVGSGKSSTTIWLGIKAHKKAHGIWYRRTHIYSHIFKNLKNEEEPLLYSNVPIYENFKKRKLYKYYRALTNEHLRRKKRMNYKSVIIIDESSLIANSMSSQGANKNDEIKQINDSLTLFLKLIRHELKGTYRNIWGSYANVYINTQSKNDNHFAFDRALNEVFYIFKSHNLPFFKLIYARELLLIDSVENEFEEDIKQNSSIKWYLMPKSIFKKYNSYAFSFLTDNKEIKNEIIKQLKYDNRFEIATFNSYKEIQLSNEIIYEIIRKEKENNGQ